jgi:glycosyltransferase involved in cell wall biosynthesis
MQDPIKCSVVVPCYNSQNSIKILIEKIYKLNLEKFEIIEIICIDDFSTDKTLKILEELKQEYKNLYVISNTKNQGQVKATIEGISKSTGEFIITLDDDCQHPTSQIIKLLKACYDQNLDFTIGVWNLDENFIRNLSSKIANLLFNIIRLDFNFYKFSAFRVIDSKIKGKIIEEFQNSIMMDLRKVSNNFKMIMVQHNPKPLGREYTSFLYRFQLTMAHVLKELKPKNN